jgi:hypothetical protein
MIRESEAKKIAAELMAEYPNDTEEQLVGKTTALMRYVRNARIHGVGLPRARKILDGDFPEFVEDPELFKGVLKGSQFVLDWAEV